MPRAAWVLETLLAPLGRRAAVMRDPAQAGGAALAYAPAPVAGVPTIPCSAEAMELSPPGGRCPRRVRRRDAGAARACGGGACLAAFPAEPGAGFAAPFDLVASAFVLLACWDERTTAERDRTAACPTRPSVFAAEPGPAHRGARRRRLRRAPARRPRRRGSRRSASSRCRRSGWMWGAGADAGALRRRPHPRPRQPVALDAARLRRRRLPHAPAPCAAATGAALRRELGDSRLAHRATCRAAPTPSGPSRRSSAARTRRGVSSTFFVIARHTHSSDGNQPETYQRRIPAALRLLRRRRREVGLHGNDADRLGADAADGDRDALARQRAGAAGRTACATTTCAASTTRRCRCSSRPASATTQPRLRRARGLPLRLLVPLPPVRSGEERPLDLLELPLAVMDATLQEPHYRGLAGGRRGARRTRRARARARAAAAPSPALAQQPLRPARRRGATTTSTGGSSTGRSRRERRPWRDRRAARASSQRWREHAGGDARDRVRVLHLSRRPQARRPAHLRARVPHPGRRPATRSRTWRRAPARGRDEHGVLLAPLPQRGRSTRFLERRRDRPGAARPAAARAARARPRAADAVPRASRPSSRASSTTCTSTCPRRWPASTYIPARGAAGRRAGDRRRPAEPRGARRRRRRWSPRTSSRRWAAHRSSASCCPTTRASSASPAPRRCPSSPPTPASSSSTSAVSRGPAAAP